ncbi:Hypothetical protein A7982_00925 [Minicystis rosea]|nr:Hypothetical protein A7982_00925 [Minicystis rosea]
MIHTRALRHASLDQRSSEARLDPASEGARHVSMSRASYLRLPARGLRPAQ